MKKCTFCFQWLAEAECFSQPARPMKLVFIKDEWFLTLILFLSKTANLVHLGFRTEISHFPRLMPSVYLPCIIYYGTECSWGLLSGRVRLLWAHLCCSSLGRLLHQPVYWAGWSCNWCWEWELKRHSVEKPRGHWESKQQWRPGASESSGR